MYGIWNMDSIFKILFIFYKFRTRLCASPGVSMFMTICVFGNISFLYIYPPLLTWISSVSLCRKAVRATQLCEHLLNLAVSRPPVQVDHNLWHRNFYKRNMSHCHFLSRGVWWTTKQRFHSSWLLRGPLLGACWFWSLPGMNLIGFLTLRMSALHLLLLELMKANVLKAVLVRNNKTDFMWFAISFCIYSVIRLSWDVCTFTFISHHFYLKHHVFSS